MRTAVPFAIFVFEWIGLVCALQLVSENFRCLYIP